MKVKLRTLLSRILDTLPIKRAILFESLPAFSDNTWAVYQKMLERGMDKKYRLVWWVKDKRKYPDMDCLDTRTRWNKLCFIWVKFWAKATVCCNEFLPRPRFDGVSFYLTHGTALKKLNSYVLPQGIDYTLIASDHVKDVMVRELKGHPEDFFALGYPRNDVLHGPLRDLKDCFETEFDKIIVWYPTFRQHRNGMMTGSANSLPILHDSLLAEQLNACAREHRVLIVVKPHFAQDVRYIRDQKLSNICFIDDSFFEKTGMSSYCFVASCDAMITDYSSIYFDHLLCRKPVAVVWEDIEDYRKNPGFAMDPEVYMDGAHKIYTLEDFTAFIRNVAVGEDMGLAQRDRISQLVNYADDGKNADRVVNFICEKAGLRTENNGAFKRKG